MRTTALVTRVQVALKPHTLGTRIDSHWESNTVVLCLHLPRNGLTANPAGEPA